MSIEDFSSSLTYVPSLIWSAALPPSGTHTLSPSSKGIFIEAGTHSDVPPVLICTSPLRKLMRSSPGDDESAGNEKDGEGKRKRMKISNTIFISLMALTSFALS
jgi:hypothetical protein